MASSFQDIVNQYLGADPIASPDAFVIPEAEGDFITAKMNQVSEATVRKQREAAARPAPRPQPNGYELATTATNGIGALSASQMDRDFAAMTANEFRGRYGDEAADQYLAAYTEGDVARRFDRQATRDTGTVLADMAGSVAAAPLTTAGSIAALGAGLIDPRAGAYISEKTSQFSQAVQQMQSIGLNNERRAYNVQQSLSERDNTARYEQDLKTDGGFIAGAKRIFRDTVDSFGNALESPGVSSDVIANAGGSLLAGGAIASGFRKVGRAAMAGAIRTGAITEGGVAASRIASLGSKAAMPAAITTMEGTAAYQQTVDAAMQRLAGRTDLTEEQKAEMAHEAGLEAGAIQGGVTLGMMLPGVNRVFGGTRLEERPFRVAGVRQALRDIAKETLEEGVQEGSAQLAQNKALQDVVDPNQTLSEGVGVNVALGAIGGAGSSAGTQAPGVALRATIETAKLPFRAVNKGLTYVGNRTEARNQKVRDDLMSGLYNDAAAAAPQATEDALSTVENSDMAPEQKEAAASFVTRTMEALGKIPTMQALAEAASTKGASVFERLSSLAQLTNEVNEAETVQDEAIPAGLENVESFKNVRDVAANAPQMSSIRNALQRGKALFEDHATTINEGMSTLLARMTNQNEIADPAEVAQGVDLVVGLSVAAPDLVNPRTVNDILYQAGNGNITLTPKQRSILRTSQAMASAAQNVSDAANTKYGLTDVSEVSREVLTKRRNEGGEAGKKSLVEHMEGVRAAYNSGDFEGAANLLTDLRFFAEHMSNKVGALNTALANGNTSSRNAVPYQSLVSRRRFMPSLKGMNVSPTNENSVRFAQQVALEAGAVVDVTNNLIDAFPDLGLEHLTAPVLDASLDGEAATVAQNYVRPEAVPVDETVGEVNETEQGEASSQVEVADTNADQAASEAVTETTQDVVEETEETPAPVEEAAPEPVAEEQQSDDILPERITLKQKTLAGGTNNRTKIAYSEPEVKTTRTFGVEAPIETLVEAFVDENSLKAMVDGELNRSFSPVVAAGYQGYLQVGERLMAVMQERMTAFLNKPAVKKHSLDKIVNWTNGQAVNIVDEDGVYDRNMAENAVLAGLQWYLKMNQYGSELDEKDVRQLLRADADANIPAGFIDLVNDAGMGAAELSRSLAREVSRFWGLTDSASAPRNYVEGVREGVAKEIIEAMLAEGMLELVQVDITDVPNNLNTKVLNRYRMATQAVLNEAGEEVGRQTLIAPDAPIRQFPTAIEKAVLTQSEEVTYVGKAPADVAPTQLRNGNVENTAEQIASIKKQQEVPHQWNVPFVDMISDMGVDMVLRLFGGGDLEGQPFNVNHQRTLSGRNLTLSSAFATIQSMVAESENYAGMNNQELGDVPVFFAYNDTVVNRAQMLGKDNPQSNKLMREAILPTWQVMDLTDGAQRDLFMMGLAQALGVKVHTQDKATSLAQVRDMLAGMDFARSILLGSTEGRFTEAAIDRLKAEGINSIAALNAVMEYTRFMDPSTDKTQFRTPVYFEADGVTNGVVNAMALFSSDEITGSQLDSLARGGYEVGEKAMPLAEIRKRFASGAEDLYGLAGTKTTEHVVKLRQEYAGDPAIMGQMNAVRDVLAEFLSDIKTDGGEEITVKRGAVKNPLTITVYGSSANGIANNLTGEVISRIYERLSLVAQRVSEDPELTEAQAFYGGDAETAQIKFDKLMGNLSLLMGNAMGTSKEGLWVKEEVSGKAGSFRDPTKFTFPKAAIQRMQANILHGFVTPMVAGISDTVGEGLMTNLNLIKTQVQSWSLLGKFAYQLAYDKALAEKGYTSKNDLLTRAEEDAVLQSVWKQLPYFQTGQQNFLFGMKQAMDTRTEFASSLTDGISTPAFGFTPDDAGVAGIPGLTIGSGDGQTILNAVNDPAMPEKFLQIFDGVHSTAADMEQMGRVTNKAVFDAWQRNPMGELAKAFSQFVDQADLTYLNEDQRKQMTRSLFPSTEWSDAKSAAQISARMKVLAAQGLAAAEGVAERHAVMAQVQSSVDQMAGAAAPHSVEGVILTGSSEQKARAMEAMRKAAPVVESSEAAEAVPAAVVTPSLMGKALEKQIAKMTNDRTERALLRDVVRSGRVDDYLIHTGSRAELIQKAADLGVSIPADRAGFMGFTVPGIKAVFVVDGNAETMLHELIHAATFETVAAYYAGEQVDTATALAIKNLEGLMEQFKTEQFYSVAHQDALDEIQRQETAGNAAAALNEFMAWSLANADLRASEAAVKANPAVRIARKVVSYIKGLLWGGKRSAAVKDDMFTNIRFNTNVVMRGTTVAQTASDGVLYQHPAYGQNERISNLMGRMTTKITDYIGDDAVERIVRRQKLNPALANASRVATGFLNAGFNMNQQEKMAFIRMVAIMATDAQLDANAMQRMQDMFTHVSKNLAVQDFLRNPDIDDVADTYQAQLKFNVLEGQFANRRDSYGRSFVLPGFIALAAVNEEFRTILSNMEMPKGKYAAWNSVDNILDNIGDMSIDAMASRMAGSKGESINEAMDGMIQQMLDTAEDSRMFVEKFTNPVGDGIDKLNTIVVDAATALGAATQANVDRLREQNPNANVQIKIAESLNTAAQMLNEENGREAATRLMSGANRTGVWRPAYELFRDLVGRTSENANVYDLIKQARAWVNGIRQQYREQLPRILNNKFSRELTDAEQSNLHKGVGRTGLSSLLSSNTVDQALNLLGDKPSRDVEVLRLRRLIDGLSPQNSALLNQKAEQLADFMIDRKLSKGLLRNADAIANLLGEDVQGAVTTPQMVEAIDHLVTLLAVDKLSIPERASLTSLVQNEAAGMGFMLSFIQGQEDIDNQKATGNARFNRWKGYTPSVTAQSTNLTVAADDTADRMTDMGFTRLGAYAGSNMDPTGRGMSYWLAPVSGRAAFAQGIMQNVQQTVGGVDKSTGFSLHMTAGQITDPNLVRRITNRRGNETGDFLQPLYNSDGTLYAYERPIDPRMLVHLDQDTNMANMMGVRSGRQSEEANAFELNKTLIDNLRDMYELDKRNNRTNEYVNLSTSADPVHKDAIKIFSNETRDYIEARFPEGFLVRKDMIDDAIGYRVASVGDAWTGTSRWSPQAQQVVKNSLRLMFGDNAYRYAVTAERLLQNIVQDARTTIVIKSVIVPMANAASNILQLMGRGVPFTKIGKEIPKKVAEIDSWHKSRIRQIEAEAELLATDDVIEKRRLRAEIRSIQDSHKRLTIWPLLQAGEFSSISDAGSREDVHLTEGKLNAYIENAVDKLPKSVRTAGKYAIMSKDTSLFRAMEKATSYGDFIAKSILYDDAVSRQKKSSEEALAMIGEEFVNYDRLPGRDRAYMESVGLMWFWNFKVRSAKVALSMVRNNPVHSAIAMALPTPISGMGLPLEDNLWASLFDGRLTHSFGYDMMFRAPGLLPLGHLLF